jgi:cytochrome P450
MFDLAVARITKFQKRMKEGRLDEKEQFAYVARAMERQKDSDLSVRDTTELCAMMLLASVDTTAGKTAWNLLQLGFNPDIQERLYQEVDRSVQKEGELNANVIDRSQTPLLHAFVRETHRITPTAFINIVKEVQTAPVTIHGVELPPGSVVAFDSYNPGMDPDLVEDPETFWPDRWLPEAVDSRKGTPKEVIDHPFFSGPFSQGARRCPGSRVANLEVYALMAQLVLDWKLVLPEELKLSDVKSKLETTLLPLWPDVEFVAR